MILDVGEKVHIIEKRKFAEDVRRHFIGEITRCTDSAVRIKGYVWIYDQLKSTYTCHPEERERIISLEGDLIINIIPKDVIISDVNYVKDPEMGLMVVDSKRTILVVKEFGPGQ